MIKFIQVNIASIIIVVVTLALFIGLWVRGKRQFVKNVIYILVCQAEQQFGSGTGEAKLALVWANLYSSLPLVIRIFFPKKVLEIYITEAVQYLKQQLMDPKFNLLTYNQEVDSAIKDKVSYKPLK